MEYELVIATYLIAAATFAAVFISYKYNSRLVENIKNQNQLSKRHIQYMAMLEIMKIFSNPQKAKERDIIYKANRKNSLYKENGEIQEKFRYDRETHQLLHYVASTAGSFDLIAKLVKENYVLEEEFLDMYADPVIRFGKVLRKFVLSERKRRKSEHFMSNFELIFNNARIYWEKKFPDYPEPEPF